MILELNGKLIGKGKMNKGLKIINCGCGGSAKINLLAEPENPYVVMCKKCGITTLGYETEAEAITAWNNAMLSNKEKPLCVEYVHDINNYIFGSCPVCGVPVAHLDKYCSECGQRLEWE